MSLKLQDQNVIEEKFTKVDGEMSTRRYNKLKFLGKGGFAECYLVQNNESKKQYAAKIVCKSILTKSKARQKLISEIRIHKGVSHKNIVKFYHVFQDEYHVYILLQVCSNSNLLQIIEQRKLLTVPEVQYYAYQLIQALIYLHQNSIIHRDIKLGNLFLNNKMELKVGDFGLAAKLEFEGERKRSNCGTPNYIAPEVIDYSKGYSYEVDTWSLGVVIFVMLVGINPFKDQDIPQTYQRIRTCSYSWPTMFTNLSAKDLIKKIFTIDPSKRITLKQILEHPFMNPVEGIPKYLHVTCLKNPPQHQNIKEFKKQIINELSSIKKSSKNQTEENEEKIEKAYNRQILKQTERVKTESDFSLSKSTSTSHFKKYQEQKQLVKNQSMTYISIRQRGDSLKHGDIKSKDIYVTNYKIDGLIGYSLSNGMVGTYEPNRKLLYNRKQNQYYEIIDNVIKIIPQGNENEAIRNCKKMISSMRGQKQNRQGQRVYVQKVLKSDQTILFKLSNGTIQATFVSGAILLTTDQDIVHITEKQTSREKKKNYLASKNVELVSAYRKLVQIMNKSKS